ncbi:uncharacterized protein LOC100375162 isoform X2 [Saccoglossus kowalevskii]
MMAVQRDKQIYYKTIKDVNPNEELLCWYNIPAENAEWEDESNLNGSEKSPVAVTETIAHKVPKKRGRPPKRKRSFIAKSSITVKTDELGGTGESKASMNIGYNDLGMEADNKEEHYAVEGTNTPLANSLCTIENSSVTQSARGINMKVNKKTAPHRKWKRARGSIVRRTRSRSASLEEWFDEERLDLLQKKRRSLNNIRLMKKKKQMQKQLENKDILKDDFEKGLKNHESLADGQRFEKEDDHSSLYSGMTEENWEMTDEEISADVGVQLWEKCSNGGEAEYTSGSDGGKEAVAPWDLSVLTFPLQDKEQQVDESAAATVRKTSDSIEDCGPDDGRIIAKDLPPSTANFPLTAKETTMQLNSNIENESTGASNENVRQVVEDKLLLNSVLTDGLKNPKFLAGDEDMQVESVKQSIDNGATETVDCRVKQKVNSTLASVDTHFEIVKGNTEMTAKNKVTETVCCQNGDVMDSTLAVGTETIAARELTHEVEEQSNQNDDTKIAGVRPLIMDNHASLVVAEHNGTEEMMEENLEEQSHQPDDAKAAGHNDVSPLIDDEQKLNLRLVHAERNGNIETVEMIAEKVGHCTRTDDAKTGDNDGATPLVSNERAVVNADMVLGDAKSTGDLLIEKSHKQKIPNHGMMNVGELDARKLACGEPEPAAMDINTDVLACDEHTMVAEKSDTILEPTSVLNIHVADNIAQDVASSVGPVVNLEFEKKHAHEAVQSDGNVKDTVEKKVAAAAAGRERFCDEEEDFSVNKDPCVNAIYGDDKVETDGLPDLDRSFQTDDSDAHVAEDLRMPVLERVAASFNIQLPSRQTMADTCRTKKMNSVDAIKSGATNAIQFYSNNDIDNAVNLNNNITSEMHASAHVPHCDRGVGQTFIEDSLLDGKYTAKLMKRSEEAECTVVDGKHIKALEGVNLLNKQIRDATPNADTVNHEQFIDVVPCEAVPTMCDAVDLACVNDVENMGVTEGAVNLKITDINTSCINDMHEATGVNETATIFENIEPSVLGNEEVENSPNCDTDETLFFITNKKQDIQKNIISEDIANTCNSGKKTEVIFKKGWFGRQHIPKVYMPLQLDENGKPIMYTDFRGFNIQEKWINQKVRGKRRKAYYKCQLCPIAVEFQPSLKRHYFKYHIEDKYKTIAPVSKPVKIVHQREKIRTRGTVKERTTSVVDQDIVDGDKEDIPIQPECELEPIAGKRKLRSAIDQEDETEDIDMVFNEEEVDNAEEVGDHKPLYPCKICGLLLKSHRHLADHMSIHPNEETINCPECPRQFLCKQGLERHILTHTGEKPHSCTYCGKRFSASTSCRRHEKLHSGFRPHRCEECKITFIYDTDLQRHILSTHEQNGLMEKPVIPNENKCVPDVIEIPSKAPGEDHECPLCGKIFSKSSSLKCHASHVHKNYRLLVKATKDVVEDNDAYSTQEYRTDDFQDSAAESVVHHSFDGNEVLEEDIDVNTSTDTPITSQGSVSQIKISNVQHVESLEDDMYASQILHVDNPQPMADTSLIVPNFPVAVQSVMQEPTTMVHSQFQLPSVMNQNDQFCALNTVESEDDLILQPYAQSDFSVNPGSDAGYSDHIASPSSNENSLINGEQPTPADQIVKPNSIKIRNPPSVATRPPFQGSRGPIDFNPAMLKRNQKQQSLLKIPVSCAEQVEFSHPTTPISDNTQKPLRPPSIQVTSLQRFQTATALKQRFTEAQIGTLRRTMTSKSASVPPTPLLVNRIAPQLTMHQPTVSALRTPQTNSTTPFAHQSGTTKVSPQSVHRTPSLPQDVAQSLHPVQQAGNLNMPSHSISGYVQTSSRNYANVTNVKQPFEAKPANEKYVTLENAANNMPDIQSDIRNIQHLVNSVPTLPRTVPTTQWQYIENAQDVTCRPKESQLTSKQQFVANTPTNQPVSNQYIRNFQQIMSGLQQRQSMPHHTPTQSQINSAPQKHTEMPAGQHYTKIVFTNSTQAPIIQQHAYTENLQEPNIVRFTQPYVGTVNIPSSRYELSVQQQNLLERDLQQPVMRMPFTPQAPQFIANSPVGLTVRQKLQARASNKQPGAKLAAAIQNIRAHNPQLSRPALSNGQQSNAPLQPSVPTYKIAPVLTSKNLDSLPTITGSDLFVPPGLPPAPMMHVPQPSGANLTSALQNVVVPKPQVKRPASEMDDDGAIDLTIKRVKLESLTLGKVNLPHEHLVIDSDAPLDLTKNHGVDAKFNNELLNEPVDYSVEVDSSTVFKSVFSPAPSTVKEQSHSLTTTTVHDLSLPNVESSTKKSVPYHKVQPLQGSILTACNVCRIVFSSVNALRQHVVVHADEWKYKCEYCIQLFQTTSDLAMHRYKQHRTEKSYLCSACQKEFLQFSKLERHQAVMHPDTSCAYMELGLDTIRRQNLTDPSMVPVTTAIVTGEVETSKKTSDLLAPCPVPISDDTFTNTCTKCGIIFDDITIFHKHILLCAVKIDTQATNAAPEKKRRLRGSWGQKVKIQELVKKRGLTVADKLKIKALKHNSVQSNLKYADSNTTKCQGCARQFVDLVHLRKHMKMCPNRDREKMASCQRTLDKMMFGYDEHGKQLIQQHKCPHCLRQFTYIESLRKHIDVCNFKNNPHVTVNSHMKVDELHEKLDPSRKAYKQPVVVGGQPDNSGQHSLGEKPMRRKKGSKRRRRMGLSVHKRALFLRKKRLAEQSAQGH